MFINIIQEINYTQHRYNYCDHEAKSIIRNRITSIKTGKRKLKQKCFKKGLIYIVKKREKGNTY